MNRAREAFPELEQPGIQGYSAANPAADYLLLTAVASAAVPCVSDGRPTPWTVRVAEGELLVSAEELSYGSPYDPTNRGVVMLCGAVIENLRIALHHRGRACSIRLFPDPTNMSLVASIRPTGLMRLHTEDKVLQTLLPPRAHPRAVHHHTGLLSPALLAVYRHAVHCAGAWLDIVADDRRRKILGDLAMEAESALELERTGRDADAQAGCRERKTGAEVPPDSGALVELLGSLGGRIRSQTGAEQSPAPSVRERIVDSPLLCVLVTPGDGAANWIIAGRALQRLLLHAAAQSMSATIFEALLEQPVARDAVKSLLFANGTPQAILRLDFEEQEKGIAQPLASAVYH